MEIGFGMYDSCELCPRRCHARRSSGRAGLCGASATLRVARSALHFWEEPPISGESGSGAIFFTGCPLRCVFCQNHEISQEGFGLEVTTERLAQMMLELKDQGANNINLVTPMHFAPHVRKAVLEAKAHGMDLPIVCNTSGYENAEVVQAMSDVVDIWLTDFKYASGLVSGSLSAVPDYPQRAEEALLKMLAAVRAAGGRSEDARGIMRRGIIVRHLVLPGHVRDSLAVLDRVWELCGNDVDLSVIRDGRGVRGRARPRGRARVRAHVVAAGRHGVRELRPGVRRDGRRGTGALRRRRTRAQDARIAGEKDGAAARGRSVSEEQTWLQRTAD